MVELSQSSLLQPKTKITGAIDLEAKAIGKGYPYKQLPSDEDLAPLRSSPAGVILLKQYFPDKFKN